VGFRRTASGTFQDGDIMLNKEGIRVVSQTQSSTVSFKTFSVCILGTSFKKIPSLISSSLVC
jgi:hypothetical protein